MSQYPQQPGQPNAPYPPVPPAPMGVPPAVPLPYATPMGKPPVPAWRKSINAFAGVSIAAGLLMLTCLFVTGFLVFGSPMVMNKFKEVPVLYNWLVYGSVLRVVLAIALLVGAMGLYSLQPWARPVILSYSILMILVQAYDIYLTTTAMKDLEGGAGGPGIGVMVGYVIWIGHALWGVMAMEAKPFKEAMKSPHPQGYPG